MKKICALLLLISLFNTKQVSAKDKKKDKKQKAGFYIKGFSWGAFSEVGTMTRYAAYKSDYSTNLPKYVGVKRPVSISFFHFGLNNHFLISQMSNEKSLSINFYPTLGVSIVKEKMLNVTLPVMFCFNTGNVSTFRSKRNSGVSFGIGAELIKAGIVNVFNDEFSSSLGASFPSKAIIQPCAAIGVRYFTRGDHAQEFNIKYGINKSANVYDVYGQMPAADNVPSTNHWFRLSFVHYIGY